MRTFILMLSCFISVQAWSGDIKRVVVEGIGISPDAAAKNAGRNAVRQAVGMYVVSDVVSKNSLLIKNEILSTSNGFIKSFDILNQTEEDGLYTVEAEVGVEVSKVSDKVAELNLTTKKVASTALKVKLNNTFNVYDDFRAAYKKLALDPLINNKSIYNIAVKELKAIDKEQIKSSISFLQGESKLNDNGSLQPLLLTFSINLSKTYRDNLQQFIEENSIKKFDEYVRGSSIFFTTIKLSDNETSFRNGGDRVAMNARTTSYNISKTNMTIMQEERKKLQKKYYANFTVKLLDEKEQIIGKIIYPIAYDSRPYMRGSTLSASEFLTPVYKTKSKLIDWYSIRCFGIAGMSCKYMNSFYDNQDDKGVVFYVDRERAEKIVSANLELVWAER